MKHRIKSFRHTSRHALIILSLVLLLPIGFWSVANASSEATLTFLEESLSLSPDENGIIKGHFTLQNKGPAVNISAFEVLLIDEKGEPIDAPPQLDVTLEGHDGSKPCTAEKSCEMPGYDVAQFTIEVLEADLKESLTGYLKIDAVEKDSGNGVVSDTLPFELKSKEEATQLFGFVSAESVTSGTVLGISLIVALLTFVLSFAWLIISYTGDDKQEIIGGDLGIISWDFKENWLANVTGLSAISTAVLALTILPETTLFLSKTEKVDEFAALSAIFGLGVTIAPLAGAMLTTIFPHRREADASRVWIFVLAVSIIMWATTGELLTILIFFDEIRAGGMLGGLAVPALQVTLILIWLAAFLYAVKKTVKSSLKIIIGQDQEEALESSLKSIASALVELVNHSPLQVAADLKFNGKDLLENLKGDTEAISVWKTLELLLKELPKCNDDEAGKKKANAMLLAAKSGLEGVLTAMRPKEDGTPQPPSALPAAVTKLWQLFEEATKVGLEIIDEMGRIWGTSRRADSIARIHTLSLPQGLLRESLGLKPEKPTDIRPIPRVYLP